MTSESRPESTTGTTLESADQQIKPKPQPQQKKSTAQKSTATVAEKSAAVEDLDLPEKVKRKKVSKTEQNALNSKRIVDAVLYATDSSLSREQIQRQYPELAEGEISRIQGKISALIELAEQSSRQDESVHPEEQQTSNNPIEFDVNTKRIVEAILFAANRCLTVKQIQQVFPELEQPAINDIQAAVDSIMEDYRLRPIGLIKLASGYRFQVREGMSPWISRLFEEKPPRYSRALLETLAIIAYRQPVTRGEIEDVRGVSVSSNIIRTLLEREWIRVIAYKEVPGRPALYGTTKQMLDYFNLSTLDQLPTLEEIKDLDLNNAPEASKELTETINSEKNQLLIKEKNSESETSTATGREKSAPEGRTIH